MLTREQLKSIYEKAIMSDDRTASEEVQSADDRLESALMDYITAIQEDTFCWAYELGFNAGKEVK